MRWSDAIAGIVALLILTPAPMLGSGHQLELVYRKQYAMGTVFEIAAYASSPGAASPTIDKAFREIVRLDHVMSDYIPDSDLSRINRTAHYKSEPVPADLYNIIQESLRYSALSSGAFDITVGPLARRWKAQMQGAPVPSGKEEQELRRCVGWRKVRLLQPNRVEFNSSCAELDLGAIGKGYAVDRAAAVLRAGGIDRALISAGGSTIYAIGSPPGKSAWLVRLRDPSGSLNPEVELKGNSVSTSEQTHGPALGSLISGHIIDPANGLPKRTPYSVSVVAETATASDALSTTLLLLGPERGKAIARKLPDVAAIWISALGKAETVSTGPRIYLGRSVAAVH